jgi:chromosome segregation ATPase
MLVLVAASVAFMTGCANLDSIYRGLDVNGKAVSVDVKQRAVFSSTSPGTAIICAEPSPDALASYGASVSTTLSKATGDQAQIAAALAEQAVSIGLRTQSIQLMRDTMYRACEAYLSGGITADQLYLLQRRFQNLTLGLLAIEQLTGAVKAEQASLTTSSGAATGDNAEVETEALKKDKAEFNTAKDNYDEADAELTKRNTALATAQTDLNNATHAVPNDPQTVKNATQARDDATAKVNEQKLIVASRKRTLDAAADAVKIAEKNLEFARARVQAYASGLAQFGPAGQGRLAVTDKVATAVKSIVHDVLHQSGQVEGCQGIITDFAQYPDKYTTEPALLVLKSCLTQEELKRIDVLKQRGVNVDPLIQRNK